MQEPPAGLEVLEQYWREVSPTATAGPARLLTPAQAADELPSEEVVLQLAAEASLSAAQVNRWFSRRALLKDAAVRQLPRTGREAAPLAPEFEVGLCSLARLLKAG